MQESKPILRVNSDAELESSLTRIFSGKLVTFHTAKNAEEAVKAIPTISPEIVLTNVELPGKSGFDLIRDLVKSHPDLPIIAISAKSDEKTAVDSFRAGAKDYVSARRIAIDLPGIVKRFIGDFEPPPPPSKDQDGSTDSDGNAPPQMNWEEVLSYGSFDPRYDREITPERLELLTRQAQKLEKQSDADPAKKQRKHVRYSYADAIYVIPVDDNDQPVAEATFVSFCRNLSAGGCSLLHNRLFTCSRFITFFPHLGQISKKPAAMLGEVMRDRPLPLGLYEIGVKFNRLVSIDEHIVLALTRPTRPH